jgi:hypothetical protein
MLHQSEAGDNSVLSFQENMRREFLPEKVCGPFGLVKF